MVCRHQNRQIFLHLFRLFHRQVNQLQFHQLSLLGCRRHHLLVLLLLSPLQFPVDLQVAYRHVRLGSQHAFPAIYRHLHQLVIQRQYRLQSRQMCRLVNHLLNLPAARLAIPQENHLETRQKSPLEYLQQDQPRYRLHCLVIYQVVNRQ